MILGWTPEISPILMSTDPASMAIPMDFFGFRLCHLDLQHMPTIVYMFPNARPVESVVARQKDKIWWCGGGASRWSKRRCEVSDVSLESTSCLASPTFDSFSRMVLRSKTQCSDCSFPPNSIKGKLLMKPHYQQLVSGWGVSSVKASNDNSALSLFFFHVEREVYRN